MDDLERARLVIELAREGDYWAVRVAYSATQERRLSGEPERLLCMGESFDGMDVRIMMYLARHPLALLHSPPGVERHEVTAPIGIEGEHGRVVVSPPTPGPAAGVSG